MAKKDIHPFQGDMYITLEDGTEFLTKSSSSSLLAADAKNEIKKVPCPIDRNTHPAWSETSKRMSTSNMVSGKVQKFNLQTSAVNFSDANVDDLF